VTELIAAAKKDPGKLNLLHLRQRLGAAPGRRPLPAAHRRADDACALSRRRAGDPVGDRRATPSLTFGTSPSVLPQASGGRLRALAVITRERSPLVPTCPE